MIKGQNDDYIVNCHVTGLDRKCGNVICNNPSSNTFGLCHAAPSVRGGSYLDHVEQVADREYLMTGVSLLHLRLKLMNALIDLAARRRLGGLFLVYGSRKPDGTSKKMDATI